MPDKFKSRKFLLALFAQVAGLLILLFPEHESIIAEATTKGGALLLMALTAFGWINAEGKIDAQRESGKAQVEQTKATYEHMDIRDRKEHDRQIEIEKMRRGDTGAQGSGSVGAIVLLGLMLCLGGCSTVQAATPADAWYAARADLTAANRVFIAWSATQDLADPEDAADVVKYGKKLQQARALLAEAKLVIDQPGDFEVLIDRIEALLIELADPELQTHDRTTSDHPGDAWSLRDRQGDQPPARPARSGWRHHARAA